MIEGSGSGSVSLTNGSGFGSGRPKTCGSGRPDPKHWFPPKKATSMIKIKKKTSSAAADPYYLNSDPNQGFLVNPNPDRIFFSSKTAIYLFLSLHEGLTIIAYRRSLQPTKRTSSTSRHDI
jgi:hypothetical protein